MKRVDYLFFILLFYRVPKPKVLPVAVLWLRSGCALAAPGCALAAGFWTSVPRPVQLDPPSHHDNGLRPLLWEGEKQGEAILSESTTTDVGRFAAKPETTVRGTDVKPLQSSSCHNGAACRPFPHNSPRSFGPG